jgi:hypothetical protein
MDRYQVLHPTINIPRNRRELLDYFISEISYYDPVLTRKANILPPPTIINQTTDQVKNMLAVYTVKELVDAYEPIDGWENRESLINVINEERRGGLDGRGVIVGVTMMIL